MLERMEERQMMMGYGIGSVVLYQLSILAGAVPLWQRMPLLVGAAKCAWEAWRASSRMNKLKVQAMRFTNQGPDPSTRSTCIAVWKAARTSSDCRMRARSMPRGEQYAEGRGSVVNSPMLEQGE